LHRVPVLRFIAVHCFLMLGSGISYYLSRKGDK